MPNHVKNIVKMEGITKLPLFKTEYDEYEKKDVVCFDFNKIIPIQRGPEILPPDDAEEMKNFLMQQFPGLSEAEGGVVSEEYTRRFE